jgi:regulator of sigma E protease
MLLTAVIFFLILSILVFVHEFGHFITAILIGVKVEEFGFGLPPRAWGKEIKGIVYSINWLPIGGFVKLAGEDEDPPSHKAAAGKRSSQYFWARSKKERAVILLAGVTMNFLLAVAITTFLLLSGIQEPSGRVHVESVVAGSPAEKAGLREGDIIKTISIPPKDVLGAYIEPKADKGAEKLPVTTINVTITSDLISAVKRYAGEEIVLTILRSGQEYAVNIVPRKEYPKGEGPMGVAISDMELKTYPLAQAPFKALSITLIRAKDMVVGIATTLYLLVTGKSSGADVAGPIGIAQVTGQAVKFGWKAVLEFMSILSLNLAVLNILPIPALDGGRFVFVVFEKILGRRVRPAFEKQTHQIGMIVLLVLVVLISINDILRIARGG